MRTAIATRTVVESVDALRSAILALPQTLTTSSSQRIDGELRLSVAYRRLPGAIVGMQEEADNGNARAAAITLRTTRIVVLEVDFAHLHGNLSNGELRRRTRPEVGPPAFLVAESAHGQIHRVREIVGSA